MRLDKMREDEIEDEIDDDDDDDNAELRKLVFQ